MKIVLSIVVFTFAALLVLNPALAAPNENASDKGKQSAQFSIPKHAVEISKGVFSLGQAVDVNGKPVQGLMIIDYDEKHKKPAGTPGNGKPDKNGNGDGETTCYAYIAKGAKWNSPESYLLDPSNGDELDEDYIISKVAQSMNSWEVESGNNIFAGITNGEIDGADTTSTDGKNEIYFGGIAEPGVLAVTIVWYERGGPPSQRDIVEYDMIFDDQHKWENVGPTSETELVDTEAYDFWAVAAHELGHAAGMDHPDNSCTEETMYAFANTGETKQRTLHDGDKAGISNLFS